VGGGGGYGCLGSGEMLEREAAIGWLVIATTNCQTALLVMVKDTQMTAFLLLFGSLLTNPLPRFLS
jgi:hypothetical protein